MHIHFLNGHHKNKVQNQNEVHLLFRCESSLRSVLPFAVQCKNHSLGKRCYGVIKMVHETESVVGLGRAYLLENKYDAFLLLHSIGNSSRCIAQTICWLKRWYYLQIYM